MSKSVVIIFSLILMFVVSAFGSLPVLFWGLSLSNYLATFCILTALQLFIGRLWNYFVDRNIRLKMAQVAATDAITDAVQHLQCVCAYCGTTNLVKILIGDDNQFNCEACKQPNSVLIESSCARTTTTIMPKAELADIFKNLDKKKEK